MYTRRSRDFKMPKEPKNTELIEIDLQKWVGESLSKTDGRQSSDTWTSQGDYIAADKGQGNRPIAVNPDFGGCAI